jgi:hypothetical protein
VSMRPVLLATMVAAGCGSGQGNKAAPSDPVRRASFRSLAARDFLFTCAGGRERAETREQLQRMGELQRFAYEKGAVHSLWLAQNEWAGLAAHDVRPPCAPGEGAYRAALGDFSAQLDELAAGIREVRQ